MLKTMTGNTKGAFVAIALYVAGASALAATPDTPPDAVLAHEPLFSTTARVKPNMVLDLSMEFPTAGAAYRNDDFDIKKSYLGYWDSTGCYDYVKDARSGYFKRGANATVGRDGAIFCSNKWSGNMLNWAASSAIDMVRYAMTGGDRSVDTQDTTVLRRAVLPSFFYRGSHFPTKSLTADLDKLTPLSARILGGKLYINSCKDQLFIGTTSTGTCDAPGTDQDLGPDGASASYFAHVQVCDSKEGPLRPDLCAKQPSGKYKPVGAIQVHSEQMRFAAFGYLLDGDQSRYGGVLRAPMKFTGPTALNGKFEKVANEAAEWDANTGVFRVDPLNDGRAQNSGVVNYLNLFGQDGKYKSNDPVGELYYESLRYLQGLPPTPQANQDGAAFAGGFPVYNETAWWGGGERRSWDPVTASCQRNHVLLIGDINTVNDRTLPGLTNNGRDWPENFRLADPDNGVPDVAKWAGIVGAFENNEKVSYTVPFVDDPNRTINKNTEGNASGPRAFGNKTGTQITSQNITILDEGAAEGTLAWAGLAYWANTQQIRKDFPDVRVKTYTIDVNENGDGTIKKMQRGSSFYLAAKYGGFDDKNKDGNPFVTSGPDGKDITSNSEWQLGVDDEGYPKPATYFLGSRPEEMIAAIRKIFAQAGAPSGSISGGAVSSTRITSNGAYVYTPSFDSTRWSGSLLAYALNYDPATGSVSKTNVPKWDAGQLLTVGAASRPESRKIFTQLSSGNGAPFEWSFLKADDPIAMHLNRKPYDATHPKDGLGEMRVEYLRGDRTKEINGPQGMFRARDSLMGDIVNSTPLLVGGPSSSLLGAKYDKSMRDRKPVVYVGANDGMLHAFDAGDGAELFAYVPRSIYQRLGAYTSPDYIHRPFVDGSPAASEFQSGTAENPGPWKTALVSGLGGGARGVFALDISNPATFSAGNVMWEFSEADDADMGFVMQAPRILKFRTGAAMGSKAAVYRWFAVVPSGFNNENDRKAAALFLLALDKPVGESWLAGLNYYKISLPAPATPAMTNALGPVGDYAAPDGSVRYLYAGDTQGNMWKFNFSQGADQWQAKALALAGNPLMVAMDDHGKRQPITIAPEVGVGPDGGAILLFGTGKFVEVDDLSSRDSQSLYGVYDNNEAIPAGETRTQLVQRTVNSDNESDAWTVSGDPFAYGGYERDSPKSPRRGWYFDLPHAEDKGERQVTRTVLNDGYLFFNTLIPNPSACGDAGGGHGCVVNAKTGLSEGGTCAPSTVGLLSSPLVVQEGEAAVTSTDSFGRRIETKRVSVINIGTGTGKQSRPSFAKVPPKRISRVAGRLNWRQVANFKDLQEKLKASQK